MNASIIQSLIQQWLSGLSRNTRVSYEKTVFVFMERIGGYERLFRISPEEISHFLQRMEVLSGPHRRGSPTEQLSVNTINQRLMCLRSLFNYLDKTSVIPKNPTVNLKPCKMPKYSYRELGSGKIRAGFRKINSAEEDILRIRDRAIALLIYKYGLRRSQIAQIRISDIRIGLLYIRSYDGRSLGILLNRDALEAIEKWLEVRNGNSGYLFVSYARRQQGNSITDIAIRDLVRKYFGCSPEELRGRRF